MTTSHYQPERGDCTAAVAALDAVIPPGELQQERDDLTSAMGALNTAADALPPNPPPPPPSGNLADAAAALNPGDLVPYPALDLPQNLLDSCSSRTILEYSRRGYYHDGRLYYLGGGHLCTGNTVRLVRWTEGVGWEQIPQPGMTSHAFDNFAVSATGQLAVMLNRTVHTSDDDGASWQTLPTISGGQWSGKHGIDYAFGGVAAWDAYNGLFWWDGAAWSERFSSFKAKANGMCVHLPARDVVWCGGGSGNNSTGWSSTIIEMDGTLNAAVAGNTPFGYGTSPSHYTSLHPCPVTGEALLLGNTFNPGVWRYDGSGWTQVYSQDVWQGESTQTGIAFSAPSLGCLILVTRQGASLFKP